MITLSLAIGRKKEEKKKEEKKDTGISVDINRNVREKLFISLGKKKKAQREALRMLYKQINN